MKGKASFGDHAGMCCVDRNRNIKREAAKSAAECCLQKFVWRPSGATMARWCVCSLGGGDAVEGAIAFLLDPASSTSSGSSSNLQHRHEESSNALTRACRRSLLDLAVMRAGIGTVDTRISQSRLICNNCTLPPIGLGA